MQKGYQSLLHELQSSLPVPCPLFRQHRESTTWLFTESLKFWYRLQRVMDETRFASHREEIRFFLTIKPHFTARVEFFILQYQSQLFQPTEPVMKLRFLQEESTRLNRYEKLHAAFFGYLDSGHTFSHKQYFLRWQSCQSSPAWWKVFDRNPAYASMYDPVVAGRWARQWYHNYITARVMQLQCVPLIPNAEQYVND